NLPDRLSRRGFLQAGAAALSFAALPGLLHAADKNDSGDGLGGFTLGVQSYTFREFDLEPALKRTKDLGLHYIELFQKHCPMNASKDAVDAILKLCKDYDVTPIAFGVEGFKNNLDENRKKFEFGKMLGIRTFSADPDPDAFDSLDKCCEEFKISIAIH